MRQWFLILETIDRIRQGQRDQRGRDQITVHKMWRFALYSSNVDKNTSCLSHAFWAITSGGCRSSGGIAPSRGWLFHESGLMDRTSRSPVAQNACIFSTISTLCSITAAVICARMRSQICLPTREPEIYLTRIEYSNWCTMLASIIPSCVIDCHQCSNKHCRAVVFHTDPLEEAAAHAIVDGINKDPGMFNMYLPKSPYAHHWRNGSHVDGLPIAQSESAPPAQSSTPRTELNDTGLATGSLGNTAADSLNRQTAGSVNSEAGS